MVISGDRIMSLRKVGGFAAEVDDLPLAACTRILYMYPRNVSIARRNEVTGFSNRAVLLALLKTVTCKIPSSLERARNLEGHLPQ